METTTETPMHTIVDCSTGEVTHRPFTAEEIAQREADAAAFAAAQAEAEAEAAEKAAARQAVLDRLGLTAEEAALLLG